MFWKKIIFEKKVGIIAAERNSGKFYTPVKIQGNFNLPKSKFKIIESWVES